VKSYEKNITTVNSGFAQRGDLCSKKSSSCLDLCVTFDTFEP
jgi:hypothetical protein